MSYKDFLVQDYVFILPKADYLWSVKKNVLSTLFRSGVLTHQNLLHAFFCCFFQTTDSPLNE